MATAATFCNMLQRTAQPQRSSGWVNRQFLPFVLSFFLSWVPALIRERLRQAA